MNASAISVNAIIQSDLAMIYQHLNLDLAKLKNTRIFITGGTGFFGKWLLHALVYCNDTFNSNIKVVVLSRDPLSFLRDNTFFKLRSDIQFLAGDIINFAEVPGAFDYVIHAATDATQGRTSEHSRRTYHAIIEGAVRIQDFAKKAGVKRLLYTSSGAACGASFDRESKIKEDFEPVPNNNSQAQSYAAAKREAEDILLANNSCETIVARCFAFCGPFLPLNGPYAFGNFLRDALASKEIMVQGDGSAVRSYLYAADLVVWLIRMLVRGLNKQIYNVGSSNPISMLELANAIASAVGDCKVKILSPPQNSRSYYVPDVAKAHIQLDLQEYTSLSSAITKSIRFLGVPSARVTW